MLTVLNGKTWLTKQEVLAFSLESELRLPGLHSAKLSGRDRALRDLRVACGAGAGPSNRRRSLRPPRRASGGRLRFRALVLSAHPVGLGDDAYDLAAPSHGLRGPGVGVGAELNFVLAPTQRNQVSNNPVTNIKTHF